MAIANASLPEASTTLPLRAAIADCLDRVIHGGGSLSREIEFSRQLIGDPREHGFFQECLYGTLREVFSLRQQLSGLMKKPLRKKELIIECLLLSGLYQLKAMSAPPHAVVNESVTACEALGRPWASGLVNAVLRNALRQSKAPTSPNELENEARWNHPQWLIGKIRKAWPAEWEQSLTAGNTHAPLTLRVNTQRSTVAAYAERLAAAGLNATPMPESPSALVLLKPVGVNALPGFSEGDVSVQDAAAQLAAPLLEAAPHHRILDACAAPGGKTMHLLELLGESPQLLALDISAERLASVAANAARLGVTCELRQGDGTQRQDWWDGIPFDRILLDAPCSGTGVIRRHPDIKLHRQPEDLAAMVVTQRALLESLWTTLAPKGRLLYATCSILPMENEQLVAGFCADHPEAAALALAGTWGRATAHGRQILPGEHQMDGFFYSLLVKHE
jgi:16S rRNA (cytosine967-C5)-methyltransferase